jgi:glycosyltransferase involved in cell wall biosynthesis
VRVVHVYKDIHPVKGGMENYVLALCRRLRETAGVDAQILATSLGRQTERTTIEGVPTVKAARLATAASTPLSLALAPLLRQMRPDIVHLHVPYPVGELAYLLATPRTPMVMTYQSDIVRQKTLLRFYAPVLDLVMRRARVILATSPQYKASSPWLRRHRARCRIVPLGIDQQRFRHPDAATLTLVQRLRARYGPNLLHSHGVFRYYKGLRYLVEALALVPEGRLLLTGTGPEEKALRAQVAAAGLEDRVHFAGAVSDADLPAYYRAADVYVLPAVARSEAFGISMVEAQASGLPCISTELGTGTSYVNVHGVTGLVVPPADAGALAQALRHLLADGDVRRAMGRHAQTRAADLFDIDAHTATITAIYREVTLPPGSP